MILGVLGLLLLTLGLQFPQDAKMNQDEPVPGSQLVKCGIVVKLGMRGAWDDGMVESPSIWFDSTKKKWGMAYAGYKQIDTTRRGYKTVSNPQVGLAWSDNLIDWKKDTRSPVFGASGVEGMPDAAGTTGPHVWFEGGTYYLFYIGLTAKGYERGEKTLNLATSTDLIHWKRYEEVIRPEGTGWRKEAIWHPNIVKARGIYYLFFNASGVAHGMNEEFIGYATSTDLYHWTVDDENSPLIVGSGKVGTWDASGRAGDPSLYKVGNRWYMSYYSWDRKNSSDGIAWTTEEEFPLKWRLYDKNPVLTVGGPTSYDALHAGKPFIVQTERRHYHFYTAVDTAETRQIALAVSPGPCR
ncbi:MAG: hypothetical protein HW374_1294 [Bacteroidetes bacterium]|nr:hypothetical protein [Bacteroidota bacterium]